MAHPHESYLKEFEIAINKLVPLTPKEVIEEARSLHKELLENEAVTEKQIHQALTLVGRKEFPYRKAYHELCASDEEKRLQELVFERIDEDLAEQIKEMTSHGVILEDYIKSDLFEKELSAEQRYQVEQAILLADDVLNNQCDERANTRQAQYKDLVAKWQKEAERLQEKIDQLRAMGQANPKWTGEINSICDRLEEGWSVVENDPSEEEIDKEREYWTTVLSEGDEEAV